MIVPVATCEAPGASDAQVASDFRSSPLVIPVAAAQITPISVVIPIPSCATGLEAIRGCDFIGILRYHIYRFFCDSNRCDCNFAMWASKPGSVYHFRQTSLQGSFFLQPKPQTILQTQSRSREHPKPSSCGGEERETQVTPDCPCRRRSDNGS